MNARIPEAAARRYRIEKYLTEGGMGAIYLGKKLGSGGFEKEVVLKQLLPEYTARPEFRDLFFREARISATLDHANIVHTFDLVESDQSLFIVMEYVRGADLRTIVRRARHRGRDLSPAAAIHLALGILAGLSYAHTRRDASGRSLDIIHRDVSPSNIICSAQGEAKLSDFGIARAATHSSVFYRVRGKVGYMSPEQARNQTIDHRCDLFSLAVCLYESLSGERLFVGDLTTPADEIYGRPVPPLSRKRPGIPATLDAVMARALAPDIEHRYATAAEFSDTLRNVAHHTGLMFSASELAAHLRDILGDDASRWLRDDPSSGPTLETQKVPAASIGLVGKEAASIGIVRDAREDEGPTGVLKDPVVSGRNTFDVDSMLSENDEETRPGGLPTPAPADSRLDSGDEVSTSETTRKAPIPQPTSRPSHTPPLVWTRDSGPVAAPAIPPAVDRNAASALPAAARTLTPASSRAAPLASPSSSRGPLPGPAQRPAAVPPPFLPPGVGAPAVRGGLRFPVPLPPPPPLPPPRSLALATEEVERVGARSPVEFEPEEATPFPGEHVLRESSGHAATDTTLPHSPASASHRSAPVEVDVEVNIDADIDAGIDAAEEPTRSLLPPASLSASHPLLSSSSRIAPPTAHAPLVPFAPDGGSVFGQPGGGPNVDPGKSSSLETRRGRTPRWLVVAALAASVAGGAFLAHRMTARDVDAILATGSARAAAPVAEPTLRPVRSDEQVPPPPPVPLDSPKPGAATTTTAAGFDPSPPSPPGDARVGAATSRPARTTPRRHSSSSTRKKHRASKH